MGLKRSQQMFTDLNKHAVKTSNSLSELYDSTDKIAAVTSQSFLAPSKWFHRAHSHKNDSPVVPTPQLQLSQETCLSKMNLLENILIKKKIIYQ